jgi:hypothetical protein
MYTASGSTKEGDSTSVKVLATTTDKNCDSGTSVTSPGDGRGHTATQGSDFLSGLPFPTRRLVRSHKQHVYGVSVHRPCDPHTFSSAGYSIRVLPSERLNDLRSCCALYHHCCCRDSSCCVYCTPAACTALLLYGVLHCCCHRRFCRCCCVYCTPAGRCTSLLPSPLLQVLLHLLHSCPNLLMYCGTTGQCTALLLLSPPLQVLLCVLPEHHGPAHVCIE